MKEPNGVVETYYDNGKLQSRANYKDGNLDGLREVWHGNGQLQSRANYKDGNLDGLCETWYDNGQLKSRANYKNGNVRMYVRLGMITVNCGQEQITKTE